jgi:hypothetical protein
LAARLTTAVTTPLVAAAPAEAKPAAAVAVEPGVRPRKPRKTTKETTAPLLLRLPATLFNEFDGEAVKRTKATGRGVSIQQVIIERLSEGGRA